MQKPLVLEHDQGMSESRRDLTWDAMYTFAERMNGSGRVDGLEIRPVRRSSLTRFKVEEGLWVGDKWTDIFVGDAVAKEAEVVLAQEIEDAPAHGAAR